LEQNGRGDINTPPDWKAEAALYGVDNYRDIYYAFLDRGMPGFTIDTTIDWSLTGSYAVPRTGITVTGKYSVQYSFSQLTEDMSRIPGSDNVQHYLTLQGKWNPARLVRGSSRMWSQ
jgi:hypothetical protein